MENLAIQRLLAMAGEQLAARPALFDRLQQDAASGQLLKRHDPDGALPPLVSLEADGLIQSSFAESQLRRFIEEWASAQEQQLIQPPDPPPAEAAAGPAAEAPLSRATLIGRLASRWPSIEADLRHCYLNGLSIARYGAYEWLESVALLWAGTHGRLQQEVAGDSVASGPRPS